MNKMNIRKFEAADTEQLVEIILQAFGSKFGRFVKWDNQKLGKMITKYYINGSKNSRTVVAEENGKILGFIKLKSKKFLNEHSSPIQKNSVEKFSVIDEIKYFISTVIPFFSSIKKDECYVTLIGVAAAGRGKGIGTKLMEEGEQIALNLDGITRYTLYVMKENTKAHKLYGSLGFEDKKVVKFPLFKQLVGYSAALFMEKDLMAGKLTPGHSHSASDQQSA